MFTTRALQFPAGETSRCFKLAVGVTVWALAWPLPASAQFFPLDSGAPLQFELPDAPTSAPPAPKPKPKPKPRAHPMNAPLPPPRPWGDRDAFTQPQDGVTSASKAEVTDDKPTSTVDETRRLQASQAPPQSSGGEGGHTEAEPIQATTTQAPSPEPSSTEPTPDSLQTAKVAEPEAAANDQFQPEQPTAAVAPMKKRADPETVEKIDATANTGRRALLLLVRPGVQSATDLDGRRIAAGAEEDEVWRALRSAVSRPLIDVQEGERTRIERLVRGEVDAIVVGIGPALSDPDVEAAAVGRFKALQIPVANLSSTAGARAQ
jgi:hypothetical protein